jgi:multicomponent Na+:H+ antiporter subunit D
VVSLSAVALVALSGTATGVMASLRYLMTAILGSLFYLLGIGLLYAQYGVLDLDLLRTVVEVNPATQAAYLCIVLGLLIKTALFPLHIWLPPAHSSAPAPVSAALSALVIKGSFYILLRFHFDVLPRALVAGPAVWLGALGMMAVLWGSLQALRQPRLKLIIAYSTVAQVGYLFLLFPLCFAPGEPGALWPTKAWAGGVFHALSHALAKASLFLSAGAVLHAAGGDRLCHLRGLGERRPVIATALALASISIMGLPPSGGFVGKWLLLVVALQSGQWWWVVGVLLGGLLAAAYSFRFLRLLFLPAAAEQVWHDEPPMLGRAAVLLAVLALLLGLAAVIPFKLLSVGAPFPANAFLEAL